MRPRPSIFCGVGPPDHDHAFTLTGLSTCAGTASRVLYQNAAYKV